MSEQTSVPRSVASTRRFVLRTIPACAPQDYTRILDREFLKQGLPRACATVPHHYGAMQPEITYCINSGKYLGEFAHNSRHMTWDVARRSIDYFMPARIRTPVRDFVLRGEPSSAGT